APDHRSSSRAAPARRPPRVEQPIAFNHRKHTQDLGLACEFCHPYVRKGAHAGLPDATTCALCHRAVQGESEESARTTELINAGDPLKFRKLFTLAPHVYYTHRRHAGIGQLECTNCHGDIAESETPPTRPVIPTRPADRMRFCIDCHREREQSVDCTSCHR
ncbi:MAG: cytochrome c3 family protein, partial [Gemmatimonadota bacterium]